MVAGHFVENIAVDPSGAVFVSQHLHERVERYDPATRRVATFAEFPTAVTGLAFVADGVLCATGGEVGTAPGQIWRVHPDGTVDDWLEVPDAVFLNGCTFLPGGAALLDCESATGLVTRTRPEQGARGSTACAFGRALADETALYVTTTGGVGLPWVEKPEEAELLRLDVGRRGVPLLVRDDAGAWRAWSGYRATSGCRRPGRRAQRCRLPS